MIRLRNSFKAWLRSAPKAPRYCDAATIPDRFLAIGGGSDARAAIAYARKHPAQYQVHASGVAAGSHRELRASIYLRFADSEMVRLPDLEMTYQGGVAGQPGNTLTAHDQVELRVAVAQLGGDLLLELGANETITRGIINDLARASSAVLWEHVSCPPHLASKPQPVDSSVSATPPASSPQLASNALDQQRAQAAAKGVSLPGLLLDDDECYALERAGCPAPIR